MICLADSSHSPYNAVLINRRKGTFLQRKARVLHHWALTEAIFNTVWKGVG